MGRIKMTSDEYELRAADLHALLSEAKSLANYDFPSALVKAKLAAEHASSLLPAPEQIQFHFFYASCLLNCGNISEALTCIDIAHKYKMKTKLIDSEFGLILLKKGVILINLNRGKPAIPILEQALQMFIRLDDQPNIVLAYLNMAQGYDSVYAFHDALECLFKALDLAKKLGHDIFLGRIYLGLGNVYANTQDHKSSTKYLKLCSALAKKINNPQLYASALGNLGRVYTLYKKFDLAKKTTLECLAIAEKYQNPHEISRLCNNLGIICNEMADYPEALSYLNRAVQMESIESNPVAFIRISLNIARSYSKLKEHSIAIKSLEEVIIHAKEINAQDLLVPAYLMAHDAMREQGSYKEALEYYIQYTETLNAIWNRDKELEFKQLESDFDNVKKQQQAEIYKLKNVQLKKRNKLINLQKSQLETALHNLQIANENKEKLFSIIAHDLRGPLSNIYQGIELALSPLFPAQDKNQFLDEIQKSAFDIYKLTENLLSWSGKQLNVILYSKVSSSSMKA
jgi:tetratricopeptide (TPR) repeat protein